MSQPPLIDRRSVLRSAAAGSTLLACGATLCACSGGRGGGGGSTPGAGR